jgi:hypothetical protein
MHTIRCLFVRGADRCTITSCILLPSIYLSFASTISRPCTKNPDTTPPFQVVSIDSDLVVFPSWLVASYEAYTYDSSKPKIRTRAVVGLDVHQLPNSFNTGHITLHRSSCPALYVTGYYDHCRALKFGLRAYVLLGIFKTMINDRFPSIASFGNSDPPSLISSSQGQEDVSGTAVYYDCSV